MLRSKVEQWILVYKTVLVRKDDTRSVLVAWCELYRLMLRVWTKRIAEAFVQPRKYLVISKYKAAYAVLAHVSCTKTFCRFYPPAF